MSVCKVNAHRYPHTCHNDVLGSFLLIENALPMGFQSESLLGYIPENIFILTMYFKDNG